jgi:hypothetical protein
MFVMNDNPFCLILPSSSVSNSIDAPSSCSRPDFLARTITVPLMIKAQRQPQDDVEFLAHFSDVEYD